jgi:hypothetical protein
MIQNPGVCPTEGFTLLGASTKRDKVGQIGKFGSGNKHGVNVCLRYGLSPVVFCGNLKLEFGTREQKVSGSSFNRVFVKYGGKDDSGVNRSSTEDLGYVLEYGATDWLSIDLALREFVSNAIDRSVEEGENRFLFRQIRENGFAVNSDEHREKLAESLEVYRKTSSDWDNVVIEVVNENQVRAKSDHTRVFIPLNEEVKDFHCNLGRWFLHFSEPQNLNKTILSKGSRNIGSRKSAVIFRRGVRVREFESSDIPSLFDYNLESLELDESRKVDDWRVQHYAALALASSNKKGLGRLIQSFVDGEKVWEHSFSNYALERAAENPKIAANWVEAFNAIAGENAVATVAGANQSVERKGYTRVIVPNAFNDAMRKMGIRTPEQVLTEDDILGRTVCNATADAIYTVDYVWNVISELNLSNAKEKPLVKGFSHLMDAGSYCGGYHKNGVVFINTDLGLNSTVSSGKSGMNPQLVKVVIEELAHYITGAKDETRDFQDYAFLLCSHIILRQ